MALKWMIDERLRKNESEAVSTDKAAMNNIESMEDKVGHRSGPQTRQQRKRKRG